MSSTKLEVYNQNGRRFIHVKVGTDEHPADDAKIEEAKKYLKAIIDKTQKDFEWVFTPHTISMEALIFDRYK